MIGNPVLVARCENVHEPDGTTCTGRLTFSWGQIQAACDTCGAWCGIAVADWLHVLRAADRPPQRPQDAPSRTLRVTGRPQDGSEGVHGDLGASTGASQ